jgi:hypothetical protein
MNINQYKNIRSCLIILKEENKKGFDNCNHNLRNYVINLLENFKLIFKDFDIIKEHILKEIN